MTREKFRLAIIIILIGFLFCYFMDISRSHYPKYVYHNRLGVFQPDTGVIFTDDGVYTPTKHGLEFKSMRDSKIIITPEEFLRQEREKESKPSE